MPPSMSNEPVNHFSPCILFFVCDDSASVKFSMFNFLFFSNESAVHLGGGGVCTVKIALLYVMPLT